MKIGPYANMSKRLFSNYSEHMAAVLDARISPLHKIFQAITTFSTNK
jgi:hypothetical protein